MSKLGYQLMPLTPTPEILAELTNGDPQKNSVMKMRYQQALAVAAASMQLTDKMQVAARDLKPGDILPTGKGEYSHIVLNTKSNGTHVEIYLARSPYSVNFDAITYERVRADDLITVERNNHAELVRRACDVLEGLEGGSSAVQGSMPVRIAKLRAALDAAGAA